MFMAYDNQVSLWHGCIVGAEHSNRIDMNGAAVDVKHEGSVLDEGNRDFAAVGSGVGITVICLVILYCSLDRSESLWSIASAGNERGSCSY